MGKQIIKVMGLEYEPESLNSITEGPALEYAFDMLRDYAVSRWESEVKENGGLNFKPATPGDKRKLAIFNSAFDHLRAILAADRNNVIDHAVIEALLEALRGNPEDFDKLYQAAVKANPQLKTEADKAKEAAAAGGEQVPDPLDA